MDIDTLIQELTKQQKTYSDMLRDRRSNFEQNINPVASDRFASAMNEGVPISSSSIINSQNMFQNAASNYVNQPGEYLSDTQGQLMSLLGLQQNQKNADRSYELDLIKMANEGASSQGLSVGEDGSLNIEPGANETAYLLKSVMNKESRVSDFTPTQQAEIRALAGKTGVALPSDRDIEKEQVVGIIDQLEQEYYGDQGQEDDLSLGRMGNIPAWWKDLFKGDVQDGRYRNYRSLRDGVTSTLKSLVGESGVLTDRDNARIKALLPGTNATPQEAERAWQSVRDFINTRYSGKSEQTPNESSLPSGQDYVNSLWDKF